MHKGYKCLSPSGRVYIARSVNFDEYDFPYKSLFLSQDSSFASTSIHSPTIFTYFPPTTPDIQSKLVQPVSPFTSSEPAHFGDPALSSSSHPDLFSHNSIPSHPPTTVMPSTNPSPSPSRSPPESAPFYFLYSICPSHGHQV